MLVITEKAKQHLKRLLVTSTDDPNLGIRLRISKDMQMGVLIDRITEDDYVVEYEGVKVLMVGPDLLNAVDGMVLDTEGHGTAEGLVITGGSQQLNKKA